MTNKIEDLADTDLDAATGGQALREGLWLDRGTRVADQEGQAAATEEVAIVFHEITWT